MRGVESNIWVPVALACAAAPAQATQYLTVEQAQRALFPDAGAFAPAPQVKRAWAASRAGAVIGYVMVDDVVGKHELITYAVGIGSDGAVRGVEILDYRETRGGEVRDPRWRAQFVGRHHGDPIQIGQDIQNISGATLSCQHVTDGIRRLLSTYAIAIAGR